MELRKLANRSSLIEVPFHSPCSPLSIQPDFMPNSVHVCSLYWIIGSIHTYRVLCCVGTPFPEQKHYSELYVPSSRALGQSHISDTKSKRACMRCVAADHLKWESGILQRREWSSVSLAYTLARKFQYVSLKGALSN